MAITAKAHSPGAEATTAEPRSGSLADVVDVILDKGLVIDAFVRVSLVGIEILTVDARIVVASVETYMHFAREAHRLEMGGGGGSAKQGLAGMMGKLAEGGAHNIARGALQGAGEGLREGLFPPRKEPDERQGVVQRAVGAIKDKATDSLREALSPGEEEDGDEETTARAQDPAPSGQAPSREPRRSRRRPPEGAAEGRPSSGVGTTPRGGQRTSSARSGRRAAPSSRRPPVRDPGD